MGKRILLFIQFLIVFSFVLLSYTVTGQDSTGTGGGGGGFQLSATLLGIIALVLGAYEVVIRIFPTVKSYSIVGWIIGLLKKISDSADNIAKKK